MKHLYFLLSLLIIASGNSSAQSETTVFESANCNFVRSFSINPEGFSSPSIYSSDDDASFFYNNTVGAWIEHSGLAVRDASIISPVFINPVAGQVILGFSYLVPMGTQYRVRIISGFTGTQLDIVATTANGPVFDPLPSPAGTLCLQLMDADLLAGQALRFEVTFKAVTPLDMLFDNFATSVLLAELPVNFLSFVAKQNTDGTTKLLWNVGDEQDVVNYVAERSPNGVDFTPIGTVTATHSSNYNLQDNDKLVETRYYRVKNVDIDGKSKYTPIIKVVPARKASGQIQLYPMPAHDFVYIQHDKAPPKVTVTIYTMEGKLLKAFTAVPNSYQTSINVADIPSGIYIIRYDAGNGDIQSAKLIKN